MQEVAKVMPKIMQVDADQVQSIHWDKNMISGLLNNQITLALKILVRQNIIMVNRARIRTWFSAVRLILTSYRYNFYYKFTCDSGSEVGIPKSCDLGKS